MRAYLLAVSVLALCCACAAPNLPGCSLEPPVPGGESGSFTLKVGELDREYILHVPASYDPAALTPLVLWIHGYTGTASGAEQYTGTSGHADTHGYIVAYPQATSFRAGLPGREDARVTSWNDLTCNVSPGPEGEICTDDAFDYPCPPECGDCGACNWCSCHDDVAFIDALLNRLETELCVDRDRIYATGMSNGGMLVHRLGCDLAARFAAIAPVAGTLARGFNCAPLSSPPISVMHIYGTQDGVVRADGSRSDDGYLYTPVEKVMDAWAAADSQGCDSEATPYPTLGDGVGGFACSQRANCSSSAEVISCYWDAGHVWPAVEGNSFGNDVIWSFFEKNTRPSPPPRVVVDSTLYEGGTFGADRAGAVFKGIPYAAAPIGDLRWRSPQPVEPGPGVKRAARFAPACPQPAGGDGELDFYWRLADAFGHDRSRVFGMPETSEDCLYLNVWTTRGEMKEKRPVMVWIHGGGNTTGWSHEPWYSGEHLARKGVVVVSINYRLGALGYLAHPALTAESEHGSSGNYGLLDQIAALRWVQRNIASFGGDPDRVTIFGESAGGANVGYLMASPLAKGLFHRGISQSGGYQVADFSTLQEKEEKGEQLAAALEVEAGENAAAELRERNAQEVLSAAASVAAGWDDISPNVDGWVLLDAPARIFAEGLQHDVPLILGSNAHEWRMYLENPPTPEAFEAGIRESYGSLADQAWSVYAVSDAASVRTALDQKITDDYFLCSSRHLARAMENVSNKAYLYQFTRVLPGAGGKRLGAYHGAEIPYVFGVFEPWMPWEHVDKQLYEQMSAYWVQFATTGDPNGGGRPQWPPYESETDNHLELGDEIRADSSLRHRACDLYDNVLASKRRT